MFFLIISAPLLVAQGNFQKGISFYKQKRFQEAADEFKKIVEDDPLYEDGYRVLGDCYLKLKKYSDAAAAFEKAVELDPENFTPAQGLAISLYNLKDYNRAVSALTRSEYLAKSPPQKYQLHHIRGSAFYNLGQFQEAAEELALAVNIQRGNFSDILQLGISNFRLNKMEEARTYLEQAVRIQPDSREAREFLGRISSSLGADALRNKDYRLASRLFSTSVENNPEDAEAWFNLGLAYLFTENFMKAEESLRKSSSLKPGEWQPYERLGYIYETTGRYEQALESYQKALEINRDSRVQESVERVRERIKRRDSQ